MNIKRIISLALVAVLALACLTGCDLLAQFGIGGGGDNTDVIPGGQKEYVIEAESTDMLEVAGAGISNNNSGSAMIVGGGSMGEVAGASNGAFVGNTHNSNTEITFAFKADKAGSATVVLMLGSELGDIEIANEDVSVLVNGTEVYHNMWSVEGSENENPTFARCVLGSINLVEGDNTIVLKVNENELKSGSTGGPNIDCIKITTSSVITFTDCFEANIEDREGV